MTFDQYLAAFALGRVLSSDLPDVGEQALREGYDSVDLAVLAGSTSSSESPRELEEMFIRGIRRVNKVIPSRAEAGRVLTSHYTRLVATGAIAPRAGASEIARLVTDLGDVLPARKYVGDALGVAEIVGLFYAHDDVQHGDDERHRKIDEAIKQACLERIGPGPA
jgi:hypothetical protein